MIDPPTQSGSAHTKQPVLKYRSGIPVLGTMDE